MKKLIIITGISGSGKTTLAKYLNRNIENSVCLSVDVIQENYYDMIGFKNEKQKKSLRKLSHNAFKTLLKESMRRGDEFIIVEFPFRLKWKKFFEECIQKYDYYAITVNAMLDSFEESWKRVAKRDLSNERHPSHELSCYNPLLKNQYKRKSLMDGEQLEREYNTLEFHQINLGKVIKFKNEDENSLKEILKKIEE